ncbi:hypothetical protein CPC08DRAFT_720773 [Agrocybe pediades]|nr:hypothetical protein CPC08DRAFT_720773 [Agrocybe pediades]
MERPVMLATVFMQGLEDPGPLRWRREVFRAVDASADPLLKYCGDKGMMNRLGRIGRCCLNPSSTSSQQIFFQSNHERGSRCSPKGVCAGLMILFCVLVVSVGIVEHLAMGRGVVLETMPVGNAGRNDDLGQSGANPGGMTWLSCRSRWSGLEDDSPEPSSSSSPDLVPKTFTAVVHASRLSACVLVRCAHGNAYGVVHNSRSPVGKAWRSAWDAVSIDAVGGC